MTSKQKLIDLLQQLINNDAQRTQFEVSFMTKTVIAIDAFPRPGSHVQQLISEPLRDDYTDAQIGYVYTLKGQT